jgi:putative nucleotidyltransferase with HDIG domain
MKRILFVDDEQPVLDGIRARLHRMHSKWEMKYVDSGPRAIAELEANHYDVIVTDMRMPGMDGAQVLQEVSTRWPEIIRIVLSGYAELQQTIRLVPIAHQYLSKPCESPRLENAIERSLQLHELLRQPQLRATVGRIKKLPAMPRTYSKLLDVLATENVTVHDVAKIVSADTVIAARVLQIVNSAFFRLARRITNIEQAVTYLGFAAVRNIVMSAEVFTSWKAGEHGNCLDLERLQTHVLKVASATQSLTNKTPLSDDALLAALLHDIGYWVLLQESPQELAEALSVATREGISMHEAETRVIGASHAEIGAYLLGLWGLPYAVIEAVAHHHHPQQVKQTDFDVLAAVAIAHALTQPDEAHAFDKELAGDAKIDADYLKTLNAPFDWGEIEYRVLESLDAGAEES